jgi:hypothetical protein
VLPDLVGNRPDFELGTGSGLDGVPTGSLGGFRQQVPNGKPVKQHGLRLAMDGVFPPFLTVSQEPEFTLTRNNHDPFNDVCHVSRTSYQADHQGRRLLIRTL